MKTSLSFTNSKSSSRKKVPFELRKSDTTSLNANKWALLINSRPRKKDKRPYPPKDGSSVRSSAPSM